MKGLARAGGYPPRTLRMARRLERLLARQPADSAEKAADKMKQVSREALDGDGKPATGHAKDVEELLADTSRKLHDARVALQAKLALEQQARLGDAIKHLHRQEQRIEAETREFAALERSGPLSRAQVFGLTELARQQVLLRDETDRLGETLGPASTFRLGLSEAVAQMRRAGGLLQEQQIGLVTQQAEQAAIARLALLLAAMEPESKDNSPPPDTSGSGGNGGQNQNGNAGAAGQNGGMIMLAEVKFLKLWQEDLNRRTQQLELDSARKPPDELRETRSQLADEQARVAEATLQLRRPQETGENAPDKGAEGKKDE